MLADRGPATGTFNQRNRESSVGQVSSMAIVGGAQDAVLRLLCDKSPINPTKHQMSQADGEGELGVPVAENLGQWIG